MRPSVVTGCSWGPDRMDLAFTITWSAPQTTARHMGGVVTSYSSVSSRALDGAFLSSVVVNSRARDRLDFVGIGNDNGVWHKSWEFDQFVPALGSGWNSVGSSRFITPPAVTSLSPTRVDVFGTTDAHTIVHNSKEQGSTSWAGWETLEGHWHSGAAAITRSPGIVDLAAIDPGLRICYKLYNSADSNPWEVMGGKFVTRPVLASCGPDQVHLFGVDINRQLLHKVGYCTGNGVPVWAPTGREWNVLGTGLDSEPAVATIRPGRLEVFCVTTDGTLTGNNWTDDRGWMSPGEMMGAGMTNCESAPLAVNKGSDKLDVFVVSGGKLRARMYTATGGGDWVNTNMDVHCNPKWKGLPPAYPWP